MNVNNNRIKRQLLILAGLMNIFIGLLHIGTIIIGQQALQYFGAPPYFVQHSGTVGVISMTLLLALFFIIVGLYAFSAAGIIRRLRALKWVLLIVGLMYTIRGAGVFIVPFPLAQQIMKASPHLLAMTRPIMARDFFFSAIALFIGIVYLIGWYQNR